MSSPHFLRHAAYLLFSSAFLTAAPPGIVVIQNARIVPVSGAVIENGGVVIRDGVIGDVGAKVDAPKGAWVIDGKGMTVYPGLIDAFSTIGLPDSALPPAPTERGSRGAPATPGQAAPPRSWGPEDRPGTNSWVKAADLVQPGGKRLEQARSAGFTSVVVFPRQGLIGGQGAVMNLGGDTAGAMIVAPSVGLYITLRGSGYTGFPETPMGAMSYFRQLWSDSANYQTRKEMYAKSPSTVKRPAYDRALEGIAGTKRLLLPAPNPIELERMRKLSAELDTPAVYYGVQEGWRMADQLKQLGVPVVLNVKWPVAEKDADPEEKDTYKTLELRDKAPASPAALSAAGVNWAVSSDGLEAPKDVIKSLKKAIDLGLKREDALRALTLSAAEMYGVADRLGSLERGKIANLVVTNGDIFDVKTKIQMIFIDGMKYEPAPEAPPGPRGAKAEPSAQEVAQ
jgi:hypothetical protein